MGVLSISFPLGRDKGVSDKHAIQQHFMNRITACVHRDLLTVQDEKKCYLILLHLLRHYTYTHTETHSETLKIGGQSHSTHNLANII